MTSVSVGSDAASAAHFMLMRVERRDILGGPEGGGRWVENRARQGGLKGDGSLSYATLRGRKRAIGHLRNAAGGRRVSYFNHVQCFGCLALLTSLMAGIMSSTSKLLPFLFLSDVTSLSPVTMTLDSDTLHAIAQGISEMRKRPGGQAKARRPPRSWLVTRSWWL